MVDGICSSTGVGRTTMMPTDMRRKSRELEKVQNLCRSATVRKFLCVNLAREQKSHY